MKKEKKAQTLLDREKRSKKAPRKKKKLKSPHSDNRKKRNIGNTSKQSKKKKHSFLLYFALTMIISGLLLLLYPIVANYLANRTRSEAVSVYNETQEKLSKEQLDQQMKAAETYNKAIFNKQQGLSGAEDAIDYQQIINEGGVMGTIDIPAIGIDNLPFYHGTSYKTLNKGLGHFENSSIPIGGENTRSVITGHSGVQNQVLFTDIRNLKEKDLFFVNILGKRLAYEIESFEEVLPESVDKVQITPKKDMVTLLTCTPPGINTYRLLVNGHRIPYEEALQRKVEKRNLWSYQNIVLSTLILCAVIFLTLGIIYRILVKKSKAKVPEISLRAKRNLHRLILITRGLFVVLLVTMITVLVIAIYGYFKMTQEPELEVIDVGNSDQLYAYNTDKIMNSFYEERQIASVNIANYAKAKSDMQENINSWGIGKLTIPSVNIDLPILAGLYNENLLNGVATYYQDQELGAGNYVLMSHSIYGQEVLLQAMDKVQQEEMIYATDFKEVYFYKITKNEVIRDTEVSVLDKQKEPIITLIRCEGDIGTIYRRLVQGRLVQKLPIAEVDQEIIQKIGIKNKSEQLDGILINENPVSFLQQFGMNLAANILSDPVQTVVPLFLLFVLPIIFLNLIREG
ncbi:sortase family protein [Enterococcus sp. LJL99]